MDIYRETQDLYARVAHAYDHARSKSLFEKPALDRLLARCERQPSILYLGSGAGDPVARYLIDQGARITGVDFAPPMSAITQSRFPDHTWITQDIRCLNLADTFDAILIWSAMFHLLAQDQIKMFPILQSHLKPSGALLMSTGPNAGETFGTVAQEPVFHASLGADHYRSLLVDHGFVDIEYRAQDPDCNGHTHWLATYAGQTQK